MPIPRARRQVSEQGTSNVRVNTNFQGGAFGEGSSSQVDQANQEMIGQAKRSHDAMNRIYLEEKGKADEVASYEALTKLRKTKTDLQYNEETGALRSNGKNSIEVSDSARKGFSKTIDEIYQGLGNTEQKDAFKKMAANEELDLDRSLQQHTMTQIQQYDSEVTETFLKTEQQTAIEHFDSPDRVRASIQNQQKALERHALRTGKSQEWVELQMGSATSSTHQAVMSRMLAQGNDLAAEAYLKNNKKEISGEHIVQLEKAVEESSLRGSSQRTIDNLWSKHGGNVEDVLAAARDIEDPKLRDEVRSRALQRNSDSQLAIKINKRERFQNAFNLVDKDPRVEAIDPVSWSQLEPGQKKSIRNYIDVKRTGGDVKTDLRTYYAIEKMAYQDVDKFKDTDLLNYRDKLSVIDFKKMSGLQRSLIDGDVGAKAELKGFRSHSQIANDTLKELGIKGDEAQVQFRRQLDEEYQAHVQDTGKKPNNKEMQAIADRLVREVEIGNSGFLGFFKNKQRIFQIRESGEDIQEVEIALDTIPEREKGKIRAAIINARGVPTDMAILSVYRDSIQNSLGIKEQAKRKILR